MAGQLAIQTIRLLTVAVLARLLTPSDYGAAAIAVALASFASTVADMGIGSALVQADEAPPRVRATAFWSSVVSGAILFLLSVALSEPIAHFMGEPKVAGMVIAGGVTFALYSVGSASQAVYMREMKFRRIELRNWFAIFVGGAVAVVAATAGAGPWALALQQVAYMGTFVAGLWFRAGWRPTLEFSRPTFRELASFAIRIAGGRWARLIELLILTMLIGKLASVAELGAWSFGMSTIVLPLSLIAIPIAEVLFSAFSRLRNEPERMSALWLDSIGYLAAVLLPVLFGAVVVTPDLIPAVFGERWSISVGVIQILSVYVLIRGLQSWGSVYMDAVGRPEVTFYTQLGSLCLTPVAVVVGIHWGIEGVAACYVIAQLIAVEIPMFVIVMSHMRLSPRVVVARLGGIAVAAAVMAVACLLVREELVAHGVGVAARAGLTIALGAAVYVLMLWWLAPPVSRRVVGLARGRVRRLMPTRPAQPVVSAGHTAPPAGRVEWLDGVRGAAALFVVLHHMWLATWLTYPRTSGPSWLAWLLYGHMAVAVFIVVSGFSLALVSMRNGARLAGGVKRFLRRRAWRILPAYWAALIVSVVITKLFIDPGYGPGAIGRTLAVHGTLLQDMVGSQTPNGAFWSIAVEWQIYFVFPLILLVGRRTNVALAGLITLIAVLAAHVAAGLGGPLHKLDGFTPQFLALFAMGAVTVWLRDRVRPAVRRRAFATVALASLGLAVALALSNGSAWVVAQFFWMDLLFGVGVASILGLIQAGGLAPARRLLASRPALKIGLFSYSIYLIHDPIVTVLNRDLFVPLDLAPLEKFGVMVVVGVPVILALSYGFHLLFEAPFLRHRSLSALRQLPLLRPLRPRQPNAAARVAAARTFGLLDDHHEPGIIPAPPALAGEQAAG